MPRLILLRSAVIGLERCRLFLQRENPAAARLITDAVQRLFDNPDLGRACGGDGMRLWVIGFGTSGDAALYRHATAEDTVYVLAFRHQREAGF